MDLVIALTLLTVTLGLIVGLKYRQWARAQAAVTAHRRVADAVHSAPGVRLELKNPHVADGNNGILNVRGHVTAHVLDMDGNVTSILNALQDLEVPMTRGMAAACEIDGLEQLTVNIIGGGVDSVGISLTCGTRLSVANY
jgi:hypothetical protein